MTTAPARTAAVRAACLAGLLAVLASASARAGAPEAPGSAAVAVVIGNNAGLPGEPVLRFAEEDAARIADVLSALGDFPRANTTLLQGRSAVEMRRAILDAEAALRRGGADGLLFVYYSGHADGEALHLAGTTFPLRELQELLGASDIATRVMVVDACRSGTLTQTKGGRTGGDFDVRLAPPTNPRGLAIVTSSASGEEAQESDELHASFFTHHFAAALMGAGDQDGDGAVTLGEAFTYAARHTVAATALTRAGPQHPTFKLALGGREELVLTRPRLTARFGHLALGQPGWYLVRRQSDSSIVAELTNDGAARPLAVAAGRYEVTRRADDQVASGTFEVAPTGQTVVTTAGMRRIEFGRVVRKGGTTRQRAAAIFALGGMRGPLLDLGPTFGGGVGGRLDLRTLTVTAAFDVGGARRESARDTHLDTLELGLRVGVLRAFDLSAVTLAAGGELGASRFTQTASDQPAGRSSFAGNLGPVAVAEVPLSRRLFLWLQGAVPLYLVRVEDPSHTFSERALRATYRVTAAVGGYL
ncbi:MAG TPA: caspase family protein [Polyangia bacterium]|nr:caspase family protein [Polyangia bacterium]